MNWRESRAADKAGLPQPADGNNLTRCRFADASAPVAEPFVDLQTYVIQHRRNRLSGREPNLRWRGKVLPAFNDLIMGLIGDDTSGRIMDSIVPCFDGTKPGVLKTAA